MIYALCQILLQLLLDAFLCIFDNGEVRYRCGACLDDLLTYLTVTSYISAACSICTGDVLRIELAELFNRSRKILHSLVRLRRENFERKKLFFFHQFC